MQANLFRSACFFILSFKPPLDYGIGETTLRGYSEPFRDLNIERLPFSPLRGLTVVKRNDVLNGLSRAFAHASPLTLPNTVVQLLQNATFAHHAGTIVMGRSEYANEMARRATRLRSKLKRGRFLINQKRRRKHSVFSERLFLRQQKNTESTMYKKRTPQTEI